jgi:EAL domain-containing protein (putative c-di-GMP-specific phosphodiesterase class I)/CheY-like chemotaxis protein
VHRLRAVTERPRVLIADDDHSLRAFFAAALEREGFDTEEAGNGREAINRLGKLPAIDVLLIDLQMPVLAGLETLREVRLTERLRTLPVIMLTGSSGEADRIRGLEGGADDFLTKPVGVRELVARVRAQVRGHAAWASELERGREGRRRLAAALESLPPDLPLLALATTLVERLPEALGLDGVAILHFGAAGVRSVGASGLLRRRFPAPSMLGGRLGTEIFTRTVAGPWLESGQGSMDRPWRSMDVAYVPFRLGPAPQPLGCLVYAIDPRLGSGPLSHRLPDLIDATDFIVVVLRPAVEQAETTDASIGGIRRMIAAGEFAIHLQPIVRLDGGAVVAVEALTRFTSGVAPESLFAEASTLGLGGALQHATMAAAIAAASSLPASVALSLNLSADVLRHQASLRDLVASTARPLVIELTEHERIDDYDAVRTALAELGPTVKLAIDDAGSGFASLRHIFALSPAYVKLDIEWVRGIDRDPVRRALVSGLVYFGQETGCELIAEGIETEDELVAIRGLGIQLGQGYLLGRPAPPPV